MLSLPKFSWVFRHISSAVGSNMKQHNMCLLEGDHIDHPFIVIVDFRIQNLTLHDVTTYFWCWARTYEPPRQFMATCCMNWKKSTNTCEWSWRLDGSCIRKLFRRNAPSNMEVLNKNCKMYEQVSKKLHSVSYILRCFFNKHVSFEDGTIWKVVFHLDSQCTVMRHCHRSLFSTFFNSSSHTERCTWKGLTEIAQDIIWTNIWPTMRQRNHQIYDMFQFFLWYPHACHTMVYFQHPVRMTSMTLWNSSARPT